MDLLYNTQAFLASKNPVGTQSWEGSASGKETDYLVYRGTSLIRNAPPLPRTTIGP